MTPRPNAFPQRLVRAAGALVWRPIGDAADLPVGAPMEPSDFQVLMVHRPRYRDWAWPKGKAELNEPMAQAAVREVEEEAGVAVALKAPLTSQRYRLGSGHTKEVRYWVGELLDHNSAAFAARPPVVPASKREIDVVQWAKPAKARQMLTRRGDRRLLNEVVARAARGELRTSTVALLRHGKAVGRSSWEGTEKDRRLTRLGVSQALDVVSSLSAFGIEQVVSSPWERCRQTVAPYTDLSHAPLTLDEVLTEDSIEVDSAQASELVRKILADPVASTAICLHRPGLAALLEPLIEASAAKNLPACTPAHLSTAEMYVAHIAHADSPRVLDIEKHGTFTKLALH